MGRDGLPRVRYSAAMPTNHQQLYRHNRWANRLLFEACRDLTAEQLAATCVGTYGPLGRTLAHLAVAEAGYVHRLSDEPRVLAWREPAPPPPMAELAAAMELSGARLIGLATSTADDRIVEFTSLDGDEMRIPGWVLLAQSIDHAREHRTHAATILTQLGIAPPDMDLWTFDASGAAAADD